MDYGSRTSQLLRTSSTPLTDAHSLIFKNLLKLLEIFLRLPMLPKGSIHSFRRLKSDTNEFTSWLANTASYYDYTK